MYRAYMLYGGDKCWLTKSNNDEFVWTKSEHMGWRFMGRKEMLEAKDKCAFWVPANVVHLVPVGDGHV